METKRRSHHPAPFEQGIDRYGRHPERQTATKQKNTSGTRRFVAEDLQRHEEQTKLRLQRTRTHSTFHDCAMARGPCYAYRSHRREGTKPARYRERFGAMPQYLHRRQRHRWRDRSGGSMPTDTRNPRCTHGSKHDIDGICSGATKNQPGTSNSRTIRRKRRQMQRYRYLHRQLSRYLVNSKSRREIGSLHPRGDRTPGPAAPG
jgi:hypothetical protein